MPERLAKKIFGESVRLADFDISLLVWWSYGEQAPQSRNLIHTIMAYQFYNQFRRNIVK